MLMKMREMMKRKDNQKGFTLIELIIVMSILAILAGLAVPKFGNVLEQSKLQAHNANVDMIYKAGQLYVATKGNPATSDTDAIPEMYAADYLDKNEYKTPYDSTVSYACAITDKGVITVTPAKATKNANGDFVKP